MSERSDALFVGSSPFLIDRRVQLAQLAARHAVPAVYQDRQHAEVGGTDELLSLGDAYRHVGVYTGRILKGAKPPDLPVVQSIKFELVINCAKHSNEKLADMAQQKVFPDRVAGLEEHTRRTEKPDGYCFYCGQPADQHHPVGPIVVKIFAPGDDETHEFCSWECLGHWAAAAAGGTLVIDRN